eukprot:8035443-Pyramimonas_sp.AAC.1
MSETPRKKTRLHEYGRESFLTASALNKVLRMAMEEDIPEHASRQSIATAREKAASASTSFGPVLREVELPTENGKVKIWIQRPFAFLEALCQHSTGFKSLLEASLDRFSNRCEVLLYSDEVTPGNPL